MAFSSLSRRHFSLAAAGLIPAASAAPALTAQDAVNRIREKIGVPWSQQTVDTFKAGSPTTPVQGIATTFMASLDVLRRAAAARCNFVISHEPTFYGHLDQVDQLTNDPVYRAKREFIEENNLVVFRFHDHWHMRKPDAVEKGLADLLGWSNYAAPGKSNLYVIPETTLNAAAAAAEKNLKIRTIRVIGDPSARFTRAGLFPGAPGMRAVLAPLDYEVYFGGEATEWEGISYARDMVAAGIKKGMVMLGHQVSEEPGMKICADWLKTILPEVPIQWLPSGEPFWRPS
jgi:putative NIF3 family GTP cyclohydrolase 1 type 2